MIFRYAIAALSLGVSTVSFAAEGSIDAMKWQRRVLLVSSPAGNDPQLAAQRHMLNEWQKGAAERDLSVVTVTDQHVDGATDSAATLRKRYHLSGKAFQVVLISKDGHVAERSAQPIGVHRLEAIIDAMPMRRLGQR